MSAGHGPAPAGDGETGRGVSSRERMSYDRPVTDRGDAGRPTLPEAMDARELFADAREAKPVLMVLTGPQVGQRIVLEDAAVVGRDPEADLMLFDESVDWHHARLEPGDET
mgnify:FL=1